MGNRCSAELAPSTTLRSRQAPPAASPRWHPRTVLLLTVAIILLGLVPGSAGGQGDTERRGDEEETRPPLTITPPRLLRQADRDNIARIANELRKFNAHTAVVVRLIAEPSTATREAAEELYDDNPVESRPGADDGLLILVEIPRDDHRATTFGFAAGPNFYPRGGITPARLEELVAAQAQPLIDRNSVGNAIVTLMQWIAVVHLFEPSPRIELTETQRVLTDALDRVAAPLLLLLALGLAALTGWVWWQGRPHRAATPTPPVSIPLDAVQAGALARGRVDDAVLTGALLQLHDRGAVALRRSRRGRPSLQLADAARCQTAADRHLWSALAHLADAGSGIVSAPGLRQLRDLWGATRREIERSLIEPDLYSPRAHRLETALTTAALLSGAAALILLVPAIVARARFAIGAELLLLVVATLVWWWTQRCSQTTPAGAGALAAWKQAHGADDPRRLTYEVVVHQDRARDNRFIVQADASGARPGIPLNSLIASVRNFGRI